MRKINSRFAFIILIVVVLAGTIIIFNIWESDNDYESVGNITKIAEIEETGESAEATNGDEDDEAEIDAIKVGYEWIGDILGVEDYKISEEIHSHVMLDDRLLTWRSIDLLGEQICFDRLYPISPNSVASRFGTQAKGEALFVTRGDERLLYIDVGGTPEDFGWTAEDVGGWSENHRFYLSFDLKKHPIELGWHIMSVLGIESYEIGRRHSFTLHDRRVMQWHFVDLLGHELYPLDQFPIAHYGNIFGTESGDVMYVIYDDGRTFLYIDIRISRYRGDWVRAYSVFPLGYLE